MEDNVINEERKEKKSLSIRDEFKNYISNPKNTLRIPTGFEKLDAIYGGGLPKGLTILGADTGLGKTTFVLHLADNMAKQETVKVLFYSLELTKYELLAKSLSRISYIEDGLNENTPQAIIHNEVDNIDEVFDVYDTISNNIKIIDNIRDIQSIIKNTLRFIKENPNDKVVVIIDYLQFVDSPLNNDKQKIDGITKSLKQISNAYDIPMILISSLSRIGDFKESGSIEYTADYLLKLFVKKKSENDLSFDTDDQLTLKFIKNRFGGKGEIKLSYIGNYATFEEI